MWDFFDVNGSLTPLLEKNILKLSSKGTLSKITAGITKAPTFETMKSIVHAMGYTLKDLDDGIETSDTLTKQEREHIQKYRALDERGKENVEDGVEPRFKELVTQICEQQDFRIIAMECDKDHCHLFVNVLPTISPHMIMKAVKGITSKTLREEFPQLAKMPSLWTRSYFASTAGEVSSETIEKYIKSQKTR